MNIRQSVTLADHSTMRLGGIATYVLDIDDRNQIPEAIAWAESRSLPILMIGGGSNIIWRDEGFPGLLLVNKIKGFTERFEDGENYYITVGSGENWDETVAHTASKGMTGIECLSLIPGTTGATPIQNVGAYGQEVAQTIEHIEAFDNATKEFVTLAAADCDFGYRTSRFKTKDRGRFFITSVTFHLVYGDTQPPFYAGVQSHLDEHDIYEFTPPTLRDAVIAIRRSKLPDPAKVANNGSFFANPIIDEGTAKQLLATYPGMPHWPMDNEQVKLPAAWLVEQCGFKDYHDSETGMGTWPTQALVLINEHAKSTADLLVFREKIIGAVEQKFGVKLEQEPELLPALESKT